MPGRAAERCGVGVARVANRKRETVEEATEVTGVEEGVEEGGRW